MNDDFLLEFRKSPRREFADTLYAKISKRENISSFSLPTNSAKRVVWAAAAVLVVFAATLAISPDARAQTGETIRKIGEMIFTNALPRPQVEPTAVSIITPPSFPYAGHSKGLSLEEAKALVPFAFQTPGWIPDGFLSNDQVGVYWITSKQCNCTVGWSVSMVWVKPLGYDALPPNARTQIDFNIIQKGMPWNPEVTVADLETLEELNINGRLTALLGPEGIMPAEPRLVNLSKLLMWTEGDLVYRLRGSSGVRVEDLIHMAETIP